MAIRTRKTLCTSDLPTELWLHIFSFVDIHDYRTVLAIERVSRYWKALFEMSAKKLYKHIDDPSMPYILNPLLDIPLSQTTKFLAQWKEYPQDPVFSKPAVLPPVSAWKVRDPATDREMLQHVRDRTLTIGDILEGVDVAFSMMRMSLPRRLNGGQLRTPEQHVRYSVQTMSSCDDFSSRAFVHVYVESDQANVSFQVNPYGWRKRQTAPRFKGRALLDWIHFRTSKRPHRHYY